MIRFPTEFLEFLRLLSSHRVEFLVVGGYAVAFHGHPRTTGDLDVWVAASPENAARVRSVLRDFGFSEEQVASAPLHLSGKVIRMGMPPLRIELLTSVSGLEFTESYARCERHQIKGIDVPIVSRADLIANKSAAGRTQDLADIDALKQPRKN